MQDRAIQNMGFDLRTHHTIHVFVVVVAAVHLDTRTKNSRHEYSKALDLCWLVFKFYIMATAKQRVFSFRKIF